MGLSTDPEKRARQMANLRAGWAKNAERLQAPPEPAAPDPKPKPARKPALKVVPYDSDPEPKPKRERAPAKQPAAKRKPAARRPAADPPAEPARRGGFWDGFLGR